MIIRRERHGDEAAARAVQVAAFRRPDADDEPIEAGLLDALRACEGWIPALSIVAEVDGSIVGHVVTSRGHVDGVPVLGLGPIGVLPSHQGGGIGLALMHASLGAADALDEQLVALLGSTAYYGRFGFVASTEVGIAPPEPAWGAHFQVRTLSAHRSDLRGTFRYAEPFNQM